MARKRSSQDFNWRTQMLYPVVVAMITTLITCVSVNVREYFVNVSDIKKRSVVLETDLKIAQALVHEKNDRIAEHRARIMSLEGCVYTKDLELSAKDRFCEFLKIKVYENGGMLFTNAQVIADVMAATNAAKSLATAKKDIVDIEKARRLLTTGSVGQRLGLIDGMSVRDKIVQGWNAPLLRDLKPGLFIPAPNNVLDLCLAIYDSLCTNDVEGAVSAAYKAYDVLRPIVDPFIMRGAEMDVRLCLLTSMAYQWVAEDQFVKGNYNKAASLMGTAAGVLGSKPPPELLAKESAVLCRALNGTCGYFTKHMADVVKQVNDDEYFYEIHNELAKLGYLQLYFPDETGTNIGKKIDWGGVFKGKKLDIRPTYKKNGDIWSTRWMGLGRYEEYNLSEEFRRTLKAVDAKAR